MTESEVPTLSFHGQAIVRGGAIPKHAAWRLVPPWQLRSALMAGCAIAISLAGYLSESNGFTQADPALARLLRGMALIKGVIALAIAAAVWWRFGRPVFKPVAATYLLGSWILMGSTTLIWQLSVIPLAAILFHASALSMLVVSWRER